MFRRNAKRGRVAPDRRRDDRVLSPRGGGVSKSGPKDVSDAKRFAELNAQMVAMNLDINAYGMDTYGAIENHRTSARTNTASPFRWAAPPANPDGSPRDQSRLKDRLGQSLNSRDINNLLAVDKVFRDQLRDLRTIEEWWAKNRNEWGLRREDFHFLQRSIDDLLYQLGGEGNVERSQYADARKQYYLQVEVANSRLEWFEENEDIMKSVVNKFKDIQTKVQEAVDTFNGIAPVPAWNANFPEDFSFERDWNIFDFRGNTVPWWNRGRGYWGIATNIREYIVNSMVEDRRLDDTLRAQFELGRQAEDDVTLQARGQGSPQQLQDDLDNQRAFLRTYQGRTSAQDLRTADLIREGIVTLERKKRDADRIAAENQDYLRVVRANMRRLGLEIDIMAHERARNRQIRAIARRIEDMLQDQNNVILPQFLQEEPALSYIQHFYMICRIHFLHTRNIRALLNILQHDDIQASDVTDIMASIQEHQTNFAQGHLDIITALLDNHINNRIWQNPEDLQENGWYKFEYEYEDMDNILFTAQELLDARKAELALKPDSKKKKREVALGNGAMALNKVVPAWQAVLGDVNTLAEADNCLSMQIDVIGGGQMSAGDALRAFFVSPDVAEYFRFTYHMRRDTFLEIINSFLRIPIYETLLDAFLMRCHDEGNLFTVTSSGRVSYNSKGFELVDEMPVAGPVRSLRPVKPVGQDDLEKWLIRKKANFIDPDPTKRVILASALAAKVMRSFPRLTEAAFMDSMHFFSRVGRMYNIPTTQGRGTDVLGMVQIRRIDNGWDIDPNTLHFDLDFGSQSFFRSLHTFMSTDKIRQQVSQFLFRNNQANEAELFQLLKGDLQTEFSGNLLGFGRIVPTQHRFHLFLRWCTQNDPNFLMLTRDGAVNGTGTQFP